MISGHDFGASGLVLNELHLGTSRPLAACGSRGGISLCQAPRNRCFQPNPTHPTPPHPTPRLRRLGLAVRRRPRTGGPMQHQPLHHVL